MSATFRITMNGIRSRLATGLVIPLILLTIRPLYAQPDSIRVVIGPDDPVMARLDDLALAACIKLDPFTADTGTLNVHGFAPDQVPTWPEEVYRKRLAALDKRTPFELVYNQPVQAYIDLYASRKRELTSRVLGLSHLYFPVFEDYLDKHGLPMELKYLAVVESALIPHARSRAAAVGLWQFIVSTGRMYGLHVDSYIDERSDVHLSTEAACLYLKHLHGLYNNWELALAAYNCGPGNVNKAVRRAGGALDYWKAYPYLPRETRGYVPAFIAVNYIFNHAADHNLYPVMPNFCAYEVDTVRICHPVDLEALARACGTDPRLVRELNPVFKQGLVPDLDKPVTIYMPRDMVARYVSNEEQLRYACMGPLVKGTTHASAPIPATYAQATTKASQKRTHTVRSGETLSVIGKKYGVTTSDIRSWNHLRSDRLQVGQKLVIHQHVTQSAPQAQVSKPSPVQPSVVERSTEDVRYIYHVVQPGDTLWDIARRYPGVTVDDIKRLNDGIDGRSLKPGNKIRVGVQEG